MRIKPVAWKKANKYPSFGEFLKNAGKILGVVSFSSLLFVSCSGGRLKGTAPQKPNDLPENNSGEERLKDTIPVYPEILESSPGK